VQVGTAHPRGLHLDDHIVRTRYRVWEVGELEFSLAMEDDALNGFLLTLVARCLNGDWLGPSDRSLLVEHFGVGGDDFVLES
jgi:hypothetical protein